MIKEKDTRILGKKEVSNAVKGFFSLEPKHDKNQFFAIYKKQWNMLVEEIKNYDVENNRDSIYILLEKASNHRKESYYRCSSRLKAIESFVNKLVSNYDRYASSLPEEPKFLVKKNLDIWKKRSKKFEYAFCIQHTRMVQQMIDLENHPIIDYDKSLDDYLNEVTEFLGHRLVDLGELFSRYLGLDHAIVYYNRSDQINYYDEMIKKGKDINSPANNKLPQRTVGDLIAQKHCIDSATKIRYLHLVKKDNYPIKEAYDIIKEELRDIGIPYKQYLPDEPSNLADRASRFRDKRFKELSLLSEN